MYFMTIISVDALLYANYWQVQNILLNFFTHHLLVITIQVRNL